MTSSQVSNTYPRAANQDCQNTCRYDGPVRDRDLILLIIAKHYWNFRTGHLDDMGFDVRDGPAGQSVFGERETSVGKIQECETCTNSANSDSVYII